MSTPSASPEPEIRRGLNGVVADTTAISTVSTATNTLLYRGYPVQELAESTPFEAVADLLWTGDLPDADRLAEIQRQERSLRGLSETVQGVLDALPADTHPMDAVRTAVSVLGALEPSAEDISPEAELRKARELFAQLPAIVAYEQRRRWDVRGELEAHDPQGVGRLVPPRDDLDYCQNFLWMTFGETAPAPVVDAFRVSMVLYAEHSFNASTFTARVIASTLSDLHSAVVGAIGALKGPLHGGANEAVMHTFDEIGLREDESREEAFARAEAWLTDALARKQKIMGFGHRVYKNGDSRVPTMHAALERMIAHYERPEILGLYDGLREAMGRAKGIHPNLDYPAGPTYHLMGFDTEMFTPLFIASRVTGWTAHVREQHAHNALIRPLSAYDGVEERHLP
ncbi:bifunctional 2-methylcitrate synthase/citrate synthase [Brachybacterium sp. EF45031]|uniref:bifunctional 2-methylcitrate synthase/citrate synthase n=1 Tax=Brachybacterium sillae TaxID=2810536 RepID=UPI00217E58F3|nr:bifunctional 2-methylcitrate synthase/citrate synthase [Brachybacterium sillae]MCS6711675.1 bifunctional 2-methylcitrate synthase/citrate synthase [Brachybacterium sillae]